MKNARHILFFPSAVHAATQGIFSHLIFIFLPVYRVFHADWEIGLIFTRTIILMHIPINFPTMILTITLIYKGNWLTKIWFHEFVFFRWYDNVRNAKEIEDYKIEINWRKKSSNNMEHGDFNSLWNLSLRFQFSKAHRNCNITLDTVRSKRCTQFLFRSAQRNEIWNFVGLRFAFSSKA